MARSASPRLAAYAAVAAVALVAALGWGRPELAALAMPFVLMVAVALTALPRVEVEAALSLERDRVLEGERVGAVLSVRNVSAAPARVDVQLPTTPRLGIDPTPVGVWLAPGARRDVRFEIDAARWGIHGAGPAVVRARDALGAFSAEGRLGERRALRAYPAVDRLRRLVAPLRTRPVLGSQVSRERGEGIEFADLRPLAAGDRARSINWRATARRQETYVNVQHPEQSADVVLFLDTFAEAEQAGEGTLDRAVHAAAALASAYLARRDRVAVVGFGGVLNWLTPGSGTRQLYRIVETLLASDVSPTFWAKDVTNLPRRLLPARALVLGLSPLLDARGTAALLDLRARGYDLAVVEISPLTHLPPGHAARGDLTLRLWRLERDALRARFETLGVPVATWEHPAKSLELAIEEVTTFRRHARPAHHA
jgi:uncharacterized protein (DUF58 family)